MRASGVSSSSTGPTVSPKPDGGTQDPGAGGNSGGNSPEAAADSGKIPKSSAECGVCEDGGVL